jgi:hypothetical protein
MWGQSEPGPNHEGYGWYVVRKQVSFSFLIPAIPSLTTVVNVWLAQLLFSFFFHKQITYLINNMFA